MNKLIIVTASLIVGLVVFGAVLVSAAPSQSPPNGNPSSPITTSATDQQKTGGFMIATDAGKQVGIGTASPGQKLTVAGTIESTSGGFKFPDATTQTTAASGAGTNYWTLSGTSLYPTSTTYVIGVGTATPDSNYEITTSGGGIKAESTSQPAGYFSSASGYGLIVNSGNVGIGTTGPQAKLTVSRTTESTTLGSAAALQLTGVPSGVGETVGARTELNFLLNTDSLPSNLVHAGIGLIRTSAAGNETGDLYFNVASSGGSSVERMRITSGGNVGIGVTDTGGNFVFFKSPTSHTSIMLDSIDGASDFGSTYSVRAEGLSIGGIGNSGMFTGGPSKDMALWSHQPNLLFYTNGEAPAKMIINSSGNVFIGGTSQFSGSAQGISPGDVRLSLQGSGSIAVAELVHGGIANPIFQFLRSRGSLSSPTAVQSGDDIGVLQFGGYDGSIWGSGADLRVIADANWTSTAHATRYSFFTEDGATRAERVRITSSGNVGIGTTNPLHRLSVSTSDSETAKFKGTANNAVVRIESTSGNNAVLYIGDQTTPGRISIDAFGTVGKPGGGTWADTSDMRLKKNISSINGKEALHKLIQLQGITYEWINPESHLPGVKAGFIAQDVEKLFPDWVQEVAVATKDRELIPEGKAKAITFPFDFNAYLIEALKEQQAEIDSLRAEIEHLKR